MCEGKSTIKTCLLKHSIVNEQILFRALTAGFIRDVTASVNRTTAYNVSLRRYESDSRN